MPDKSRQLTRIRRVLRMPSVIKSQKSLVKVLNQIDIGTQRQGSPVCNLELPRSVYRASKRCVPCRLGQTKQ